MYRKIISVFLTIVVIVATFACVVGCNSPDESVQTKEAVCILLGAHANSKGLNLSSKKVQNKIIDVVKNYGFVSAVNIDGSPEIVFGADYNADDDYKNNASKSKQDRENTIRAKSILKKLSEVKANDSEVDIIESISVGLRTFASVPDSYKKTFVIVDNGIQTTGVMNFQNNIISAEPEYIVKMLKQRDALPNLKGINVIWEHLGDVASPQTELSASTKKQLIKLWQSIIEASGGNFEFSDTVPNTNELGEGLPEVSVIKFPEEAPIKYEDASKKDSWETTFLSEEDVGFNPDTSTYSDAKKAKMIISEIAEYMKKHSDFSLLLVGTTASDYDSQENRDLSLSRANAVKDTLVNLGISKNKIYTLGLGSSDPWHISNLGVGEEASVNRKVVMLDSTSAESKSLMKGEKNS